MKALQRSLWTGSTAIGAVLLLSAAAAAQTAPPAAGGETLQEVVVTATRRSENLQDVPLAVTHVTGQQLQELNLTQFTDIQRLAPGLQLSPSNSTLGPVASLRGVSYTVTSGAAPAVDTYLNEVPINALLAFQSIYDLGSVEVLRGPQGTLRGEPAPVGAITMSTHRPSLSAYGGSANVSISTPRDFNAQGGVNIPIVQDKLALRLAALYDKNDNGDVENQINGAESRSTTKSLRISALWRPIERLEVTGTYQYLYSDSYSLNQLIGPGLGYNGPPLSVNQRQTVQEGLNKSTLNSHFATLEAKYDLDRAVVTYIGGYQKFFSKNVGGDSDAGNLILNGVVPPRGRISTDLISHELRLDSEGANRFWDYTVGVFYSRAGASATSHTFTSALPGAFGDPAVVSAFPAGPINPRYAVAFDLDLPITTTNKSIFASNTFHLPTHTDVTVGARHVWNEDRRNFSITFPPAFVAASFGFPTTGVCPFIPGFVASQYPTSCDLPINVPPIGQTANRKTDAWVYNASVTQHFTDNINGYFSFGHSWRPPGSNQGTAAPPSVFLVNQETSNEFELGVKSELFNRRLRVNADVFQQTFNGFIGRAADVPYVQAAGTAAASVTSSDITFNGDAKIRGFEADIYGVITDKWWADGTVAYADAKYKNANIPCRDTNFDGVPDNGPNPTVAQFTAAGTPIAFCASNGPISTVPKWSASMLSEYTVPLNDAEAYLRGLVTYNGSSQDVSTGQNYSGYTLVNLYAGVRKLDGLDIGFFAKNLFDVTKVTSLSAAATLGQPTGYNLVTVTPPREIGINVSYAFGGG